MNRERFAWIVSIVVIAFLSLHLPGSLAQREDDYAFVRTLVDIHRQVAVNYAEKVEEEKLREAAINGMLSTLDPFTEYVPPRLEEAFTRQMEGTFKGVGIELNERDDGVLQVVTPIDGTPAAKAGVQAGDIITKVNGEFIAGMRRQEIVDKKIKGPEGTEVTLTVQHLSGQVEDLKMNRADIVLPTVKGFDRNLDNTWNYLVLREPKIAYIRITQFTGDTASSFEPVVRKLAADGIKGLVLDLRLNPGGRMDQAVAVADLFLESGTIVSTKGRNRPEHIQHAVNDNELPPFPVAVIVNEGSASASEIVAGALADNRRAVVVGARSYGKGSFQEVMPLGEKQGELKMTVGYYYLPSGRLVHRKKDSTDWGVEPSIKVEMPPEVLREVWQARLETENWRRPPSTNPASIPAQPATRPTDTQLEQAVKTLVAQVMMNEKGPTTRP